MSGPRRVAGVDGCRAGWVVASATLDRRSIVAPDLRIVPRFADALREGHDAIAVDIPIGLPDAAEPGGRACDRLARARLGRRAASVFSPPVRAALGAATYREALAINRASSPHGLGFTIQCWNIVPKIREVDALMTPGTRRIVHEAHPELCFATMAGSPMTHGKATPEGRAERLAALRAAGIDLDQAAIDAFPRKDAKADDVLDACACLWTAARIARGAALSLPGSGPRITA
jgi:predicted RNase H-like nuclease